MSEVKLVISKSYLPDGVNFRSGLMLLIDKPKGWTSFDVVNKIRYKIRHKLEVKKFKVGHAGTLDPMATGLLMVCVGKYTKLIDQLQGMDKSYLATLKLGATTPSYDAETEEDNVFATSQISAASIEKALADHTGNIMQKPPIFSALKVDGVRLYKKARKGQKVEIKPRPVTIHKLDMISYEEPTLVLDTLVSKGTYIRSLAFDIGRTLDSGAYLRGLIRTSVDKYVVEDALSIEEAISWIENCAHFEVNATT